MLQGLQQQEAVIEITTEIDNLRAVWQYAIDHRLIDVLWTMTQSTVLTWFYELRSWYQECEALTRRAVEALRAAPPTNRQEELLLGNLVGNQGWHVFRCGRPEEGMRLLQESLAMLRPGDHPDFLFITLEQLAYLTLFTGDFERAVALVEAQQPVLERITDPWLLAHARFQRAAVYVDRAPDLAYERFHEGLPYMRTVGDRYVIILSLCHLGDIAVAMGKLDEAEQSFTEVLSLSRAISNGVGEANALGGLAMIACARHAWDDAIMYSLEAMARSREVGDTWTQARALISLGEAEIGAGDPLSGRRNLKEAISLSLAARVLPIAIDAWLRLAALDVQAAHGDETLLLLLALVRRHPVTGYYAAGRAGELWAILAAHVDAHALHAAERAASAMAPDRLEPLLRAYLESRAVAMPHTDPPHHAPQPTTPTDGLRVPATGETLSPREVEVLRLLIAGASNQAIADALVISIYTAKHHVASILQKLGVVSRTQAALHGRALGLEPLTTQ
jgi:ATP/maltotriose-dependent transcriptional regulator MalT